MRKPEQRNGDKIKACRQISDGTALFCVRGAVARELNNAVAAKNTMFDAVMNHFADSVIVTKYILPECVSNDIC